MRKTILLFAWLFIPGVLMTGCGSNSSPTSNSPTSTPTPSASVADVFVAQFGGTLSFASPQGVAGNSAGTTLYVSDTSSNYVYAYTKRGRVALPLRRQRQR
jgi:DNA-binding beta-propeller fold protein YncE